MVVGALLAAGSAGCGGDAEEPEPGVEPEPVVWGECPPFFQTECATVELPLRYDEPEGAQIPILVARKLSGDPEATQLWLLAGGPGGSGGDLHEIVDVMAANLPGFDIYTLDHRGVGQSARLGCSAEEETSPGEDYVLADEWEGCAAELKDRWGEGLAGFSTTNAAQDVGMLIERTREPGQRAMVWGVSYGTYWALRYLQLHPEQPAAVVLDSVASPGAQRLSTFDLQFDPVAKELAAVCAADAACAARMGDDPWARIDALYEKIDAGHCSALGIDRRLLRQTLAYLVAGATGRSLLMPVVYRLDRCEAADMEALAHLFEFLFSAGSDDTGFSQSLQNHVMFSEMWEVPAPSVEALEGRAASTRASQDLGPYVGPAFDVWPRYAPDALVDRWPRTEVPLLMLNGTMDPQTPIETARVAGERLRGPLQTFVTVQRMVHGVLMMPSADPEALSCGAAMTFDFLKDPSTVPDTSCAEEVMPIPFELAAAQNQLVFGTDDTWDNPAPKTAAGSMDAAKQAAPARIDVEAVARALSRVRPLSSARALDLRLR
ncbi:Hypothetical protein CAP_8039 [Chondromyces apiculatus DSM 436]|uniref:Uncharacterized protein n=1 Tax=Chondromyces apiculatus DSM 436 TaxID=1192034 RepID=A0A017SXA7_9BACT|nr:Hypothetical protein CAP_8039 [Chondromyces apiculatus DSM 436]